MNILDTIIARKRIEIRSMHPMQNIERSHRNFVAALRTQKNNTDSAAGTPRPGVAALIAEVKPKSPSAGKLINRSDVPAVVKRYNEQAQAISVLCDTVDFGGGYDLLREVRSLTNLPILAKEFIVDKVQIDHARTAGADAILLIAAVLTKQEITTLAGHAMKLGMAILLELHTAKEVEKIPNLSSDNLLLGINNRNLADLSIDLSTTEKLAPLLRKKFPKHMMISESGISSDDDVERLGKHVDGFLVGTSLLREKCGNCTNAINGAEGRSPTLCWHRPAKRGDAPRSNALKQQIYQSFPLIKICGITKAKDARLCEELGIDMIGFNFVPSSPRCISIEIAKKLSKECTTTVVGIFKDANVASINQTIKAVQLDTVQLHGNEPIELLKKINVPVIKAFRAVPPLKVIKQWMDAGAFVMLDGTANGKHADWKKIEQFPASIRHKLFIAGGLNPANVSQVIERIQPYAIDCASGVESLPGIKDHQKMKEFVRGVRSQSLSTMPNTAEQFEQSPQPCNHAAMQHANHQTTKHSNHQTSPHFGPFGGQYVSELLVPVLQRVAGAYAEAKDDPVFQAELSDLLKNFAGRPTPLTHAKNLSKAWGCTVLLKREDLLHGGAHKTNNVLGQGLLAVRMGAKELIAETGAGQHGTAVAMVGALFKIPTKIFMGSKDIARQQPNVQRMRLFGAEVISVESGSKSLKDAINDAMRYWVAKSKSTYYVFGTVAGPHPFPQMVANFQRIIGDEAREQCLKIFGRLPHSVIAAVGGGSNAIGIFKAFIGDTHVQLIGVEPAGEGLHTKKHGAALCKGTIGCLHGAKSYCLQDSDGQILEAHSISAGLDYPGVGPEHSYLKDTGRAQYMAVTDDEAVDAFQYLSKTEGIIPALESAHAVAGAKKIARAMKPSDILIINISGRGDKDLAHVAEYLAKNKPKTKKLSTIKPL